MDFAERIQALGATVPKQLEHVLTEEATKNAFVMPFINALGYNVFDPLEVTPELCADVGVKKGEKVDYAILRDGKPIILFECKHHTTDLDKIQPTQLFRYFSVAEARFAVLTNGIVYRFYTDLEAPNKLDERHFFEINLRDLREGAIEELKKFSKSSFDTDAILETASELKYTREIRRLLSDEVAAPSDEFVRLFAKRVYPGLFTQSVRERFAGYTKRAFLQLVNDRINERLKSALVVSEQPAEGATPATGLPTEAAEAEPEIVTTEDEREAFLIVRAILCGKVDVGRIVMRDMKNCCLVLLDDTIRRPICRLYFKPGKLVVGLVDPNKAEERVTLNTMSDLYGFADRFHAVVAAYDAVQAAGTT